jgi:penicillin-binding protein 2
VGGGYYPAEYEGLGLERMGKYAEMFGLGSPTGVDLPGEARGLVPNQKWKRLNYAETWLTGDTYNMSIGQGFVLATPLQMLNAFAAIANNGVLYKPHLVKEILDADDKVVQVIEPEKIRQLEVEPQFIQLVQEGLRDVIAWEAGTAYDEFDVPGIIASGKTGTAEYCDRYPQCLDRDGRVKTSHAWFASYAPSNDPEIVTIVFVYGGGEGSLVAIPVTNKILRHYFKVEDEETQPEEAPETEESVPSFQPETTFTARLLGADSWGGEGANISGFVLDATGKGVADISIDLLVNSEVMTQTISGQSGQFDFTLPDPTATRAWQVRLSNYADTLPLQLDVAKGTRYLVEFEANAAPVAEALPPEE